MELQVTFRCTRLLGTLGLTVPRRYAVRSRGSLRTCLVLEALQIFMESDAGDHTSIKYE